jgi:hypothetical protein
MAQLQSRIIVSGAEGIDEVRRKLEGLAEALNRLARAGKGGGARGGERPTITKSDSMTEQRISALALMSRQFEWRAVQAAKAALTEAERYAKRIEVIFANSGEKQKSIVERTFKEMSSIISMAFKDTQDAGALKALEQWRKDIRQALRVDTTEAVRSLQNYQSAVIGFFSGMISKSRVAEVVAMEREQLQEALEKSKRLQEETKRKAEIQEQADRALRSYTATMRSYGQAVDKSIDGVRLLAQSEALYRSVIESETGSVEKLTRARADAIAKINALMKAGRIGGDEAGRAKEIVSRNYDRQIAIEQIRVRLAKELGVNLKDVASAEKLVAQGVEISNRTLSQSTLLYNKYLTQLAAVEAAYKGGRISAEQYQKALELVRSEYAKQSEALRRQEQEMSRFFAMFLRAQAATGSAPFGVQPGEIKDVAQAQALYNRSLELMRRYLPSVNQLLEEKRQKISALYALYKSGAMGVEQYKQAVRALNAETRQNISSVQQAAKAYEDLARSQRIARAERNLIAQYASMGISLQPGAVERGAALARDLFLAKQAGGWLQQLRRQMAEVEAAFKAGAIGANEYAAAISKLRSPLNFASQGLDAIWSGLLKISVFSFVVNRAFGLFKDIVNVIGEWVKAGADAVETQNYFNVVFKNNVENMQKWVDTVSESLKMNRYRMMQETANWTEILSNMGIAMNDASRLSKLLQLLAIDIASLRNKEIAKVTEAMLSGLQGNIRPLRALGIDVSELTLKFYALATGIRESAGELTALQRAQAVAISLIMGTASDRGDFIATMNTAANLSRAIKEEWAQTRAEMGKTIAQSPLYISALQTVRDLLGGVVGLMRGLRGESGGGLPPQRRLEDMSTWEQMKLLNIRTFLFATSLPALMFLSRQSDKAAKQAAEERKKAQYQMWAELLNVGSDEKTVIEKLVTNMFKNLHDFVVNITEEQARKYGISQAVIEAIKSVEKDKIDSVLLMQSDVAKAFAEAFIRLRESFEKQMEQIQANIQLGKSFDVITGYAQRIEAFKEAQKLAQKAYDDAKKTNAKYAIAYLEEINKINKLIFETQAEYAKAMRKPLLDTVEVYEQMARRGEVPVDVAIRKIESLRGKIVEYTRAMEDSADAQKAAGMKMNEQINNMISALSNIPVQNLEKKLRELREKFELAMTLRQEGPIGEALRKSLSSDIVGAFALVTDSAIIEEASEALKKTLDEIARASLGDEQKVKAIAMMDDFLSSIYRAAGKSVESQSQSLLDKIKSSVDMITEQFSIYKSSPDAFVSVFGRSFDAEEALRALQIMRQQLTVAAQQASTDEERLRILREIVNVLKSEQEVASEIVGNLQATVEYAAGGLKNSIRAAGEEISKQWAQSFAQSVVNAFESGGVVSGFRQVFKSLGRIFGSTLGKGLIDWLFGKQITDASGKVIKTPGLLGSIGVEDWWQNVLGGKQKGAFGESGQVRQLMFSFGTMIAAYGMQKGNRAATSVGFAASAAAVASALSTNPYTAIVAAIIAAIVGWFAGDGKDMIRYQLRVAFNRVRVGEITGGVPREEEQAIQRQLQERYDAIRRGFYRLGVLLLSSLDIDWSRFKLTGPGEGWYERETKNLQNALQAFMNHTLPRAMLEFAWQGVAQALLQSNLGVRGDVLQRWREAFDTGEFDKVMERFQNWVALLVNLRDALEETGRDINAVISDIKKGTRERWQEDFAKRFEKMQNIFQAVAGSDIETSLETYNSLLEQARDLYNSNIEYLRNLVNLQEQLNNAFQDYQRELRLAELRQSDFNGLIEELSGEFTSALRGMREARNPEELQKFAQEVLRSAQSIMQLVDAIKQWIEQLDELKREFDGFESLLNRNIFQWIGELNKNSTSTFTETIGKAINRITELKRGIDSLTPEQKIARFREMAGIFHDAMQALDDFARAIDDASRSITESIDSMLEDIKIEEFDKSGDVRGKAQYIIDQMHRLYQTLSQATSPEEVNSIVQQILRYAGMLRQMGEQVQLDIGGGRLVSVNEWLQMLLPDVSTIAQNKLNEFRTQWEGARNQLLSQLSGLADDIAGERTNLQNVLNDLTNLVKDNLNPAIDTANQLLGRWIDEVARANDELNNFVLSLQGAVAALAPLQPIPTQPGEGGGDGEGEGDVEPPEPGRRTPLGELAYGATNAAQALDIVRVASEELASRFAALGGAVSVNITLDRGLLADVWGQTDLVRLSMRE